MKLIQKLFFVYKALKKILCFRLPDRPSYLHLTLNFLLPIVMKYNSGPFPTFSKPDSFLSYNFQCKMADPGWQHICFRSFWPKKICCVSDYIPEVGLVSQKYFIFQDFFSFVWSIVFVLTQNSWNLKKQMTTVFLNVFSLLKIILVIFLSW